MKTTVMLLMVLIGWSCTHDSSHSSELSSSASLLPGTSGNTTENLDSVRIWYSYAGMGSGFGRKGQRVTIEGLHYVYEMAQNTFYEKPSLVPDTLGTGQVNPEAIERILALARTLPNDTIHRFNTRVMGGGIDLLSIEAPGVEVDFWLHNAGHPIAKEMADILNEALPGDLPRIQIGLPEEGELPDTDWGILLPDSLVDSTRTQPKD